MTVESDLYTALATLVTGGRVFPDVGPLGVARPYLTYQQIGGVSVNFLNGAAPSKRNARFQVNSWAATRIEAMQLIRAAEDLLKATTALYATAEGAPVALYEEDTQLYGARQDFSVWFAA